jgi:hypothetical protein
MIIFNKRQTELLIAQSAIGFCDLSSKFRMAIVDFLQWRGFGPEAE